MAILSYIAYSLFHQHVIRENTKKILRTNRFFLSDKYNYNDFLHIALLERLRNRLPDETELYVRCKKLLFMEKTYICVSAFLFFILGIAVVIMLYVKMNDLHENTPVKVSMVIIMLLVPISLSVLYTYAKLSLLVYRNDTSDIYEKNSIFMSEIIHRIMDSADNSKSVKTQIKKMTVLLNILMLLSFIGAFASITMIVIFIKLSNG